MFRLPPYQTLLLLAVLSSGGVRAQFSYSIQLEKPKEYEDRILRSERTPDKKIRMPQRILQNTVTRYNYFFNASNKLNEVIERAKLAFQDDYTQLLPFYNYSLEKTAEDAVQLDSVIWKTNSGVVLHDLRNDWTDDLYLLWGAAYYFQRKFDSARILFQFINQTYAPREKDGYPKTIGSARDGNSALSISTPEKKGRLRKLFSKTPPRRNDAFIWQIRNYIAQDQLTEAASLIEALRRDPQFPTRLQTDLHEVQAWLFYQQQNWDSTAKHLSLALDQATHQNERARWEYLLGQLYERSGKWTEAEKYYRRCIPRTTNPILEIYARLGSIRTNRDGAAEEIAENIRALKQMAKRDMYADYRDIIYFMAAQMQIQTCDRAATKELLINSVQVPSNNPSQRNQAFEQLARLCLEQKEYRQAFNYYDSIQLNDPKLSNPDSIRQYKEVLGVIATQLEIIERQDSLLRIISLPEGERKEFIRALARELRRQQGLKDDYKPPGSALGGAPANFGGGGDTKGEWYFYNTNSRARGVGEFQARWGNRPNADQWRRLAALTNAPPSTGSGGNTTPGKGAATPGDKEISFESLYASLPLSAEQQLLLHDSLQQAWFILGKTYIQRMDDCINGTRALEHLIGNYPECKPMDDLLFLLYYCHQKSNETEKAKAIRTRLETDFPKSEKTQLVVTGKDPTAESKSNATRQYQQVYDQFITGQCSQAVVLKKQADSVYGNHYWTPQLLYVEAICHLKQHADSLAISQLNYLIQNFPSSALTPKAENLIRVLIRRDSIEQALRDYAPVQQKPVATDSTQVQPRTPTPKTNQHPTPPANANRRDSLQNTPREPTFSFAPQRPHQVVVILQEIDPVFANEAKNSVFRYNRVHHYATNYELELIKLSDKQHLLLINPFSLAADALTYLREMKRLAPTEIFSWLSATRYRFSVIDLENLTKVQAAGSFDAYEKFLLKDQPNLF